MYKFLIRLLHSSSFGVFNYLSDFCGESSICPLRHIVRYGFGRSVRIGE